MKTTKTQNTMKMSEIEKKLCKMSKMTKKELDDDFMGRAFFSLEMHSACDKFLTPEQHKMLSDAFIQTLVKMKERKISFKLGGI